MPLSDAGPTSICAKEAEKWEKHDRHGAIDQIYSLTQQFSMRLPTLLAMREKRESRKATIPDNTYSDLADAKNACTVQSPETNFCNRQKADIFTSAIARLSGNF